MRDVLSGDIDEKIGCLEVPKSVALSQILIADWLDEKAYSYFMRGDVEMSRKSLLTAINCAKRLLKGQNEFETNDIEDEHLKKEINEQKLVHSTTVINQLYTFYTHLCYVCHQPREMEIIREHLKDLESYRPTHPSIQGAIRLLSSHLTNPLNTFMIPPMVLNY